jgi:predicted metal-dependent enzyme (double-stranded beta helix superfamily)
VCFVVEIDMDSMYSLPQFIADLDRITRTQTLPDEIIAEAKPLLAQLVRNPDCIDLRFKQHGLKAYGRYMLHRAPQFNVTSVVWGPGDKAKAHNHDSWGLVGVLENELQETRFRRRDDGSKAGFADLVITAVNRNVAGMVSSLLPPEDDIHEMLNVTEKNTVEIHVYGKDLANMQRLQFDVANKSVNFFASAKYDNC